MMITSKTPVQAHQRQPPASRMASRIEESADARASQVKALIRERRRIALTFKRTRDEHDRVELELIDKELAKYRINIPAIQEQVAVRKGRHGLDHHPGRPAA